MDVALSCDCTKEGSAEAVDSFTAAAGLFLVGRHLDAMDVCLKSVADDPYVLPVQSLLLKLLNTVVPAPRLPDLVERWVAVCGFGDLDIAEVVLSEAFGEDPDAFDFFASFAAVSARLRRHDASIRIFERCLTPELPPEPAVVGVEAKYQAGADAYDGGPLHESSVEDFAAFALPLLAAIPGGGLAVVDACCGTGIAAPWLRPVARTLIGIDLSQAMLDRAESRGLYDHLIHGDVTARLAEVQSDVILCHGATHYFRDIAPLAGAAFASLRSGGLFLFPDAPAPEGTMSTRAGTQRFCRAAGLVRGIFEALGFELVGQDLGIAYGLPHYYWAFRKPLGGSGEARP